MSLLMRKSRVFQLKLDDEEFADLHQKAAEAGVPASELIRERLGLAVLAKVVRPPERLEPPQPEKRLPKVIPPPKVNETVVPDKSPQVPEHRVFYNQLRARGVSEVKAKLKIKERFGSGSV